VLDTSDERFGLKRELQIEGRPVPPGQSSPHGDRWNASPDYFKTMRIPLIKGRYFTEHDRAGSTPVAIIDETLAAKYWPDEDPVGKRITFEGGAANPIWREIVGVVGYVKQRGLENAEPRVQYYIPHRQRTFGGMYLVVRTAGDPASLAPAVRGAIGSIDKDQPVYRVTTMEQMMANSLAQRRFAMLLLGIFAALAMVLAAVGLYGVMSYSVTQRTHEIGIRMALGAKPGDVLKMVVGQGAVLTSIGVGIGLVASFILTRWMAALLFGVSATDPVIFASIAVALSGVALLASYIPARRATKVDPMIALRYE
jgi:putative ABC transport system permease protein